MKTPNIQENHKVEGALKKLTNLAHHKQVTVAEIVASLDGQGYGLLIVIFSLPFAFPITIPGLSSPFGILQILFGVKILLHKRLWLPPFIRTCTVKPSHLRKIIHITEKTTHKLRYILHHRLTRLCHYKTLIGITLCIQGFFMALPLPVPFSNTVAATPIVFLGLGLLAYDGLFILLGWISSLIAIGLFTALFWFGFEWL